MAKTEKVVSDKKETEMPKGGKVETIDPQPIKAETPVIVVSQQNEYEAIPGFYHLVKLDDQGNDILGSDFSISPRTYRRTYERLPNFRVKKSPKA